MKWKFIETSVYTHSHLDCICDLYAKPMKIIIITGLFDGERVGRELLLQCHKVYTLEIIANMSAQVKYNKKQQQWVTSQHVRLIIADSNNS